MKNQQQAPIDVNIRNPRDSGRLIWILGSLCVLSALSFAIIIIATT